MQELKRVELWQCLASQSHQHQMLQSQSHEEVTHQGFMLSLSAFSASS